MNIPSKSTKVCTNKCLESTSLRPRNNFSTHTYSLTNDEIFHNESCVAIDCEMVGVGPMKISVLGRVSIVNFKGDTLLDTFVKVEEKVTDYRTRYSGIRPSDLLSSSAMSYGQCRTIVQKLIRGKVLVGHGLVNDLSILQLQHPFYMTRDTSVYWRFVRQLPGGSWKHRRLADLASDFLGQNIQINEHCSLEDAAAAMALYQLYKGEWDQWISEQLEVWK